MLSQVQKQDLRYPALTVSDEKSGCSDETAKLSTLWTARQDRSYRTIIQLHPDYRSNRMLVRYRFLEFTWVGKNPGKGFLVISQSSFALIQACLSGVCPKLLSGQWTNAVGEITDACDLTTSTAHQADLFTDICT